MAGPNVQFYYGISCLSFIIFLGIFLFSPWISKLFSSKYKKLPVKDQINWDTRFVRTMVLNHYFPLKIVSFCSWLVWFKMQSIAENCLFNWTFISINAVVCKTLVCWQLIFIFYSVSNVTYFIQDWIKYPCCYCYLNFSLCIFLWWSNIDRSFLVKCQTSLRIIPFILSLDIKIVWTLETH